MIHATFFMWQVDWGNDITLWDTMCPFYLSFCDQENEDYVL